METENTQVTCDIDSLKREITENEKIINDYLTTARNMKWMAIATACVSVAFLLAGSIVSGIAGLVLSFICVRKYNRSLGMAEVYFGVTKFLKYILQREITGDTSIPGFLAD